MMPIIDTISKTLTQGVDRVKFEADKFQKTTRIQGELNQARKDHDDKLKELGQRAYELFRAGQIGAPTVAALAQELDLLQSQMTLKEEELKAAQSETFVEGKPAPTAQHVPVQDESAAPSSGPIYTPPPSSGPTYTAPSGPSAATKSCPNCHFQMPQTALFCPSCGNRVG